MIEPDETATWYVDHFVGLDCQVVEFDTELCLGDRRVEHDKHSWTWEASTIVDLRTATVEAPT